jgi:hypothetical protein
MEAITFRIFMNTIQRLINGRKSPHSLAENAEVRFPSRLVEKHMSVLEQATRPQIPKIFTALILLATVEQAHGRASILVMIPKRKPSRPELLQLPLVINEKAYIVGGQDKSDCWEYVPGTNTWTEVAPFRGGARGYAAGFAVGKLGYFGTGSASGSGGTDDFWAFDPTAAINDDDDQ